VKTADLELGSERASPPSVEDVRGRFKIPWATIATLAGGAALIIGTERWARLLRSDGIRLFLSAPPLTGSVEPRLPAAALWVALFAALVVWRGPVIAASARFRMLAWLATVSAAAWALLLALTDGVAGLIEPVSGRSEYLHDVGRVGAVGPFLHGFVANIGTYTTHVRAHPPGMLLLLWSLSKAGLPGPGAAVALELLGGAAAVPAVMIAIRELAGEEQARIAAPFLILAPFAVMFGSGDALFMGVGAWACASLILAIGRTGRESAAWAVLGGVLLGAGLMLSYGLVLLVLLPAAVIVARRRADVGAIALGGVAFVLGAFALAGFRWWEGLAATRAQYAESIARFRPSSYFLVANLAALAIAVGPAAWVGLARLRDRRVWLVTGASLLAIALADLSGLSKGEVERIWLPFMPWLVAGAAWGLISSIDLAGKPSPASTARRWLTAQVVWTLGLQLLVRSPW